MSSAHQLEDLLGRASGSVGQPDYLADAKSRQISACSVGRLAHPTDPNAFLGDCYSKVVH
jgi:hypothetical protein